MLATPPPGYNPASINRQQPAAFSVPGQQGGVAQGYLNNPFRSSYATPSSYAVPSSVPAPNPWYAPHPQMPNPANAQMLRALAGGR